MVKLPFDPKKLSPEEKKHFDEMSSQRKSQGAPFGGPYLALMNHPELCQKIEALGFYLKFQGHLPRDVYQFVVLSVARETKASFEWIDHVEHAVSAGIPGQVIEMVRTNGINDPSIPEPYCFAANVLHATLLWKNIPEVVQSQAINAFGTLGFVEIVVLSGFYQMFSAINQGFDIAPPKGEDPFA